MSALAFGFRVRFAIHHVRANEELQRRQDAPEKNSSVTINVMWSVHTYSAEAKLPSLEFFKDVGFSS